MRLCHATVTFAFGLLSAHLLQLVVLWVHLSLNDGSELDDAREPSSGSLLDMLGVSRIWGF